MAKMSNDRLNQVLDKIFADHPNPDFLASLKDQPYDYKIQFVNRERIKAELNIGTLESQLQKVKDLISNRDSYLSPENLNKKAQDWAGFGLMFATTISKFSGPLAWVAGPVVGVIEGIIEGDLFSVETFEAMYQSPTEADLRSYNRFLKETEKLIAEGKEKVKELKKYAEEAGFKEIKGEMKTADDVKRERRKQRQIVGVPADSRGTVEPKSPTSQAPESSTVEPLKPTTLPPIDLGEPKPQQNVPPKTNVNIVPKTEEPNTNDKAKPLIEEIARYREIQLNPELNTKPQETERKLAEAEEKLIKIYYEGKNPEDFKNDPVVQKYVKSIEGAIYYTPEGSETPIQLSPTDESKTARRELVERITQNIQSETKKTPDPIATAARDILGKESKGLTQTQSTTTPKPSKKIVGESVPTAAPIGDAEVMYPRSTANLEDVINKTPGLREELDRPKAKVEPKTTPQVGMEKAKIESKKQEQRQPVVPPPVKKEKPQESSGVSITINQGKMETASSEDKVDYDVEKVRAEITKSANISDKDIETKAKQESVDEKDVTLQASQEKSVVEELKTDRRIANEYLNSKDEKTKKDIEKYFALKLEADAVEVEAKKSRQPQVDSTAQEPTPKTAEDTTKPVSADMGPSDRRSNEELSVVRDSLVEERMSSKEGGVSQLVLPMPVMTGGKSSGDTTQAMYNPIPLLVVNDEEVIRMNSFEANKLRMV